MTLAPEPNIDCIDCGGRCSLITRAPELGWAVGDLVTYRCADCLDRWDLLLEERGSEEA